MSYYTKFLIHITLVFSAFVGAYELRRGLPLDWWLTNPDAGFVFSWALVYAAVAGIVELFVRSERTSWRFSSLREAMAVLRNTAMSTVIFAAVMFVANRGVLVPRSSILVAWLLSFLFLVGIRVFWRLMHDPRSVFRLGAFWSRPGAGVPLIVVGNLASAEMKIRRFESTGFEDYRPLAIITSDRRAIGQQVRGIPVVAETKSLVTATLHAVAGAGGSGAVLFLDDPAKDRGFATEDLGRLRKAGLKLLRSPPAAADLNEAAKLQEIPLEEFLPRSPIALDSAPLEALIKGRRLLVTGAGGSIGSEISRQLVALGCGQLVLLDHSEFALFEIGRELQALGSPINIRSVLCNVREADRLNEVFKEARPEIVFHAAALKHVTLVEQNPLEGFLTNVVGTRNVIEAAKAYGAAQVTLISTDKAVEATSVMGATKRIAEALVACQPPGNTQFSCVRFGNVLGSNGSVIPLFREQIETGGPVTITDPEVERYFMTIAEAVQLVLHATALSAHTPASKARRFVLEMGEPVKIIDLARQLIQLHGLRPDVDIAIQFTGLKPGEKLSEQLTEQGDIVEMRTPGVLEIVSSTSDERMDLETTLRMAASLSTAIGENIYRHDLPGLKKRRTVD